MVPTAWTRGACTRNRPYLCAYLLLHVNKRGMSNALLGFTGLELVSLSLSLSLSLCQTID